MLKGSLLSVTILGRQHYARKTSMLILARRKLATSSEAESNSETEASTVMPTMRAALSPSNSRLLRVSIIGMPNAGKSTLINQLLSFDVCPVSKRVHTTRENQQAIFLRDNTQIVFMDTPGVVNRKEAKKFSFAKDFVSGPENAMKNSDVVGVLHDVSNGVSRHKLDPRVVNVLKEFPAKNTILILNKVDALNSKRLLLDTVRHLTRGTVGGKPIPIVVPRTAPKRLNTDEIINRARTKREAKLGGNKILKEELVPAQTDSSENIETDDKDGREVNGWAHFQDVFMISALTGDGVDLLQEYFVTNAISSPWIFNEEVLTDCPPTELALRIIKAKMLEHLPLEIPYRVSPKLEYWDEGDSDTAQFLFPGTNLRLQPLEPYATEPYRKFISGELRIIIGLECPNERVLKIVIGQGGGSINVISMEAEKNLTKILQQSVDLHVKVKCRASEKDGVEKQKQKS